MRAIALSIALGSLVAAVARTAVASPQDLYGYGPRSVAMGGTGVAVANDVSATYANPARLSSAHDGSLSLGFDGAVFQTWYAVGTAAAQALSLDRSRGVLVGLVIPIPLPSPIGQRVTLGVGLNLPLDVIARNRVLRPETPQFLLLQNRTQAITLQGGVGIELPAGIRIGGGAAALAALGGSLTIQNDANGNIGWQIDDRIVVTYAPAFGASWERGPFRIGTTWRGALVGQLQVQIVARDLGITLPPFNISGVPQYDPWQVALEVGVEPGNFTFAAGATFKRWSEYPGPIARTTMMSPSPPVAELHDTFVIRAGGEHRWHFGSTSATLRAGYIYEPTPIPSPTGVANYLDNDRHVITLGGALSGHLLGTTMTFDLFAQWHILATRTAAKDPSIAADNPGSPSITSGGSFWFVGSSLAVSL